MTAVVISCDVELSWGLHRRGVPFGENVASSIHGVVAAGAFGIGWQCDVLERHGLKGVFLVDPLPALVGGDRFIREVAARVLPRGHEIGLHIHTEWLEAIEASPVGDRRGRNIGDFALEDQVALLGRAMELLMEAGIPRPVAFRAGNYGANDDTLRALSRLGITWDTSHNPAYVGRGSAIGIAPDASAAVRREGVVELPVTTIHDRPGSLRPAQVCALSEAEMRAALRHAARSGQEAFVIVTHSFEMLTRDRRRPNRLVMRRFEALCEELAGNPGLRSACFGELDAAMADRSCSARRLPASLWRTGWRMAEQGLNRLLCERRLRPA